MPAGSSTYSIHPDSPSPNTTVLPPAITPHNVPPVSSMVEYNLHRLASISSIDNTVSPDMSDNLLTTGPNVSSNFILDEMLNGGDQQMLNNLQALAKIGDLNNGNTINTLGMMDTFMSSNTPLLQTPQSALTGINDDIKLNCFSPFSNTNRSSPDAANNNNNSIMNQLGSNNGNSGRAKALSMQIRVKFGALGQARGQFNSPHGFCLGLDEEIVVADTNNHRIEVS